MFYADYLVFLIVLFSCFVDRQSLYFLCAFALSECLFYSPVNSTYYALSIALVFSYLALIAKSISYKLQMALVTYSIIYWFASIDYLLFTHGTYFYAIFPYIIKVIDIYVLFQLINTRGRIIGSNHSAPSGNWV